MNDKRDRHVCTKKESWDKSKSYLAVHPDAKCVYSGDHYDKYECPHCGERFKVECED